MAPDEPVPVAIVHRLCRLAMWAPNHKRTWPWRFGLCAGDDRAALGEAVADAVAATWDGTGKHPDRYRQKYLRAAVIVLVGQAPAETTLRLEEDRDAVACGVQNLLLGATAAGLASFWSSPVPAADDVVAARFTWEPGTRTAAFVSLGWPRGHAGTPPRPPLSVASFGASRPAGTKPTTTP